MIATREFMIRMFPVFNASIFKGALPVPVFRISNAGSYRGQYRCERRGILPARHTVHIITLSSRFDLTVSELEDVLIHEMLHMYISVNRLKDSSAHGRIFREMMDDINTRHSRHLVISHRDSGDSPTPINSNLPLRVSYICVCNMADGRRLVAKVATTRIHDINQQIGCWNKVRDIKWYATLAPAFQSYPAIRTLKLYTLSPAAEEALTSSQTHEMEFADTAHGRVLRLKRKVC